MKVRKIDPSKKYSNKDIPYSNDMRQLTLEKMHINVDFVISVSTPTRTYWCYMIKVSKLTTSIKCDNNKLIYYKIYNAKNLFIKAKGSIPSTKSYYYYNHNKNCSKICKLLDHITNGAILNAISAYNVSNCKMYKLNVYIILELRLILVPKYLIQLSWVNTISPPDYKWLKHGANYYYTDYCLYELMQYLILVLFSPINNDRYVKVIKVSLPGDLKSRSIVFNVIWTGYVNIDLDGKMLYVWGYCERRTTSYRKHTCKTSKIIIHKFNLLIKISIQNKPTTKTL